MGISQGPDAQDERMGVLVHRIDKDTSGLLVVAKNEEAQLNLAKQFFVKNVLKKHTEFAQTVIQIWNISANKKMLSPKF